MTQQSRPNTLKKDTLGIPEVLARIRYEKLTVPVPVKLWPSVAEYVKQKGGSSFIRTLILDSLTTEAAAPPRLDTMYRNVRKLRNLCKNIHRH